VATWRDYVSLLKLRISALLLLVAAAGYLVARGPAVEPAAFGLLMASGLLASCGASAVNHYVDRDVDRTMTRTRSRPIPAGRVPPVHALVLGTTLLLASVVLAFSVNALTAAFVLLGFVVYVFVYTIALKRRTVWNIVVGGFAGSCPALAGSAAAAGVISLPAALLALLVNMFSGGGGTAEETSTTTGTSLPTVPIAPLTPIRVTCTSQLTSFPCEALLDGNPATSWNATDGGIGVDITFLFAPPVQITELAIQNVEDECRFLRNARMKGIEVFIDDLTQTIVTELEDSRDLQRIDIRSLGTSSLIIRITSGYSGSTCDGKEPYPEMAAQDVFFWGRATEGG